MSRLIPQNLVTALKSGHDASVRMFGLDCILYSVINYHDSVANHAYSVEADKVFDPPRNTIVQIVWDPERVMLNRYGLFYDKEAPRPILARFLSDLNISEGSYIKIETKFRPAAYDVDEFEVVSRHTGKTHDEVVMPVYKLAPRRVKPADPERRSTASPIQPAMGAYN